MSSPLPSTSWSGVAPQRNAGKESNASPAQSLAALLQQRVWLRLRRRRAWLEHLRSESSDPESVDFFNDPDDPQLERRWQEKGPGHFWSAPIQAIEEQLAGPLGNPLRILSHTFGLSTEELDLVQTVIVHQLDPTLGPALAFLHGQANSAFVSGPTVARLFGHERHSFWHPLANVRHWKLVHARDVSPGEAVALEADPMLIPWTEGNLMLDPVLAKLVRRVPPCEPLAGWPIDDSVGVLEQCILHRKTHRLIVSGGPQSGRATFAATVADQLGVACVAVDCSRVAEPDWEDVFLKTQRFAILGGFAVIWTRLNGALPWPRQIATAPVQVVTTEAGRVPAIPGWTDHHVHLPPLGIAQKHALWERSCPAFTTWPEAQQEALTRRYQLSVGQITAIGEREPLDGERAMELARESTRSAIGDLGEFLPCPFEWNDMVLPTSLLATLQDLTYEAANRADFWEQPAVRRLYPRGRGLTVLLSGSPGTGKTMAAQVIARELQMDLFRIDLARLVSKYIGETAKHLSEVFSRASRMSAILLFDEADALFAKRTQVKDSHDRYANADTSYLLQLLEEFQGLALLTTNKRGNIDPAFYRRLRYVHEFPKPGPEERLQIWQRLTEALFGSSCLAETSGILAVLASDVEISPAQIKNTLLASAFIAQRRGADLTGSDLIKGLERELSKEGRALDDHIRQRLT